MRALITGASGFAGPYLESLLRAEGAEVRGFSLRHGQDVRDYEQLLSAVRSFEPDLVFHLAAVSWPRESVSDPRRCLSVNVTGTLNLLEAVRHCGCAARVLLAGTSEEYGYDRHLVLDERSACFPATPYGASKLAATGLGLAYGRSYGVPVVATRAFNHTGWGRQACNAESSFARRIVAWQRGLAADVPHGDLSASRNFTNVRDTVRAYRTAIMLDPGIYNVCSPDTVTMARVMALLADAADAPGLPLRPAAGLGAPPSGPFPQVSCAPLTQAGWAPQIPLEETMAELISYWRSR